MRLRPGILLFAAWTIAVPGGVRELRAQEPRPLQPVPSNKVQLDDSFWGARQAVIRDQTLWHNFKLCEDTGRIANFEKAAGLKEGKHEGYFFNDSDVYKVMEGAAYALAQRPDPKLDKYLDDLIAKIAKAQRDDGYLNTYYQLTGIEKRFTEMRDKHELYCAGHLIEAAIAHHDATGKRTFLDVAIKLADYIGSVFGADKRRDICGHPEIELALIKLSRHTGEPRYQKLAQFFVDEHGHANGRQLYGEYCQDDRPVREQREITGHAVRAMYLYSAVADLAAATHDPGYDEALNAIWHDVVDRKMYVTGGIGPSAHNEGFTVAYDLPNDTAYAETCAGIGLALWNYRLGLLHADARYADVMERALYNGILSGVSLDGTKFFYVNPLSNWGEHRRRSWYDCACCPPNLLRLLLSIGGYVYAHSDDAIYVNLYAGGKATIPLSTTSVELTQVTKYPWEGNVELSIQPEREATFSVFLRIPGWCKDARLCVNGQPLETIEMVRGYAHVERIWKRGDKIELELPMPPEIIEANPSVKATAGRVAIQRGPIVYCLEGVDNNDQARRLALPRESDLQEEYKPDLLGGVTVIHGTALTGSPDDWSGTLYRPTTTKSVEFTAIPYYAWENRTPSEMTVWLPESPTMLDPTPLKGVKASASHCWGGDTIRALNDQLEPKDSADATIPRFTWWDHRGTEEWVQYDFDKPRRVGSVAVYWFDDTKAKGGCRPPASWRLQYRDGTEWKPVKASGDYGVKLDQYNRVTFDSVETTALRLVVQLPKDHSVGILEWKVDDR